MLNMVESNAKIVVYEKTGSFAPASWVAVVENDDGERENLRISYRDGQLLVLQGQTPLRGSNNSKKLIDREVETEQSDSRLKEDVMISILEDEGFRFDEAQKVSQTNDKIQRIIREMDGHLENYVEPEN